MTLQIPLTPEMVAKLRERAASAGKDLQTFVREVLEEEIATGAAADAEGTLAPERWSREWRAWATAHPKLDHIANDDRGSIYAGRGE